MFRSPHQPVVPKHQLFLSNRVGRRAREVRPRCEALEPRLQPSTFFFSTGNPDGRIATLAEPANAHDHQVEYETGDDFVLTDQTKITQAAFTGLLADGATPHGVKNVVVVIYQVFPNGSNVARTSGPPTFSTPNVPTRVNSPSDVAFRSLNSAHKQLSFRIHVIDRSYTALASVSSRRQRSKSQIRWKWRRIGRRSRVHLDVWETSAELACWPLFLCAAGRSVAQDPSRSRFPLAVCPQADRVARYSVSARQYRPTELGARRPTTRPGLAPHRHGHHRGYHVQCDLRAGRTHRVKPYSERSRLPGRRTSRTLVLCLVASLARNDWSTPGSAP